MNTVRCTRQSDVGMTGRNTFCSIAGIHPIHRVSTRAVFLQPHAAAVARVLARLPELGAVLCHVSHGSYAGRGRMHDIGSPFAGHAWRVRMNATVRVRARVALDSDGPREWLECVQADGRVWMRIWLLPDSDFCAWDGLLRHLDEPVRETEPEPCALRSLLHDACSGYHRGCAALVQFTLRQVAGMACLSLCKADVTSPLSRQRADALARQLRLGAPA